MSETHSDLPQGWWFPQVQVDAYLTDTINAEEMMLLGKLGSLHDKEKRGCWASNRYLSKWWGKSISWTSITITKLEKLGLIEVERKGESRLIRCPNLPFKKSQWVIEKSKGGFKKSQRPSDIYDSTVKENNCGGKAPSTNVGFLKTDESVSPFIKKTTSKLEDFVRSSRRLDRRFNRQKWYREIELLLQEVNGDKKRIIKALRAYIELIDIKECRPIIDSAASFREKFDKVERYVEKHEHILPPEPIVLTPTPSKPLTKEAKETIARLRASLNNE